MLPLAVSGPCHVKKGLYPCPSDPSSVALSPDAMLHSMELHPDAGDGSKLLLWHCDEANEEEGHTCKDENKCIENADATPPHLDVFLRVCVCSSADLLVSLQILCKGSAQPIHENAFLNPLKCRVKAYQNNHCGEPEGRFV